MKQAITIRNYRLVGDYNFEDVLERVTIEQTFLDAMGDTAHNAIARITLPIYNAGKIEVPRDLVTELYTALLEAEARNRVLREELSGSARVKIEVREETDDTDREDEAPF